MQEKEFTIQELKENPSFRRMVRGIASADEVDSWNRWIESSDENRLKAKKALSEMVGFKFQSPKTPNIEQEWKRLRAATIGNSGKPLIPIRRNKDNTLRWIFRTVAVILLVSFVGVGTYLFQEEGSSVPQLEQLTSERTITTEEGEQKTLKFSNGSRVVLNSNSSITYRLGAFSNQTIDITLEGEAWFDAESGGSDKQPAFAVRTPDGIIRDIGTEFLVSIQHNQSRVIIQEGIVEVEPVNAQLQESLSKYDSFRATQGEMVEFNRKDIVKREQVNPTLFTSWATGYMNLDETGLEEFTNYIENRFRVQVVLNDSGSENIALNGTVYFRSLDELVRSVSEVTGIPAYRSTDTNQVFIGELHETINN